MKPLNATVKNLMRHKLAWGIAVIVFTQVLGMLPALDFLPANWLKVVSFLLGVGLTAAKGVEMFYEQIVQMEQDEPAPDNLTADKHE